MRCLWEGSKVCGLFFSNDESEHDVLTLSRPATYKQVSKQPTRVLTCLTRVLETRDIRIGPSLVQNGAKFKPYREFGKNSLDLETALSNSIKPYEMGSHDAFFSDEN